MLRGRLICIDQRDQMCVVTVFGMVNLKGKSVAEHALGLISIAHPDLRDALEQDARTHRLIPQTVYLVRQRPYQHRNTT